MVPPGALDPALAQELNPPWRVEGRMLQALAGEKVAMGYAGDVNFIRPIKPDLDRCLA